MKTPNPNPTIALALLALFTLNLQLTTAKAQGTAFTYQGRLKDSGAPANGTYDFRFRLASDALGNNYVGSAFLTNGIGVSNGLFIATLDFGPGLFTGSNYWLEVDVRSNGVSGYTTLNPLQALTPTPYAIFANSASNLSGTLAAGSVGNNQLANSSITITAGTGLNGGGTVALGGSTTLNNVGVTALASGGGVTVSAPSGAVTLGSTATSADTPNAIVSRDGSGNFSAGSITLAGQLILPSPVTTIYSGGNTLLYSDANDANFFAGYLAGYLVISGDNNTACGAAALADNTTGSGNVANGANALGSNTNGFKNTAVGVFALEDNTSGQNNIAIGYGAGSLRDTGSNNICIGNIGQAGNIGTIRIGDPALAKNTFIAGIYGVTAPSGVPVYVNSSGQLGTLTSSQRFKQNIQNMGDTSDVLYSLQPVTFQYKPGIDPKGTPEFGLVAEQVEKVDPALVVRDKTGQPYTVRY
jgi:Chaperone of endosialidase